ncbi:F-box domain containing protein [Trema orientale]|uniref:F-box domain containing protein n=1 Tax=Trema orientale TaxID=63057 RepID=A0A2P5EFX2_TREOI|nr:F-box domain containing protein [Trema orientale]
MLERALRVRRKKAKSERRRSTERCTSSSRYIPDDLLHEIMIRLPNLASAVRCSSVCKRWRSITCRSDFTATFMDHIHRPEPKRPLRLLFGGIADEEFSIRVVDNDNGMMMMQSSSPPPPVAAASVGAKLLLSYDPFKDFGDVKAWKSFRLPHDFLPDDSDLVLYYIPHLRLGLSQGRLRLSQFLWDDPQHLSLKVWDLMDNNNIDANAEPSPITLVHQTLIDAAAAAAAAASVSLMSVSVPAFHPIHHNQIFMLFDSYLYRYDLDTKKQVMVAEIENNSGRWDNLRVFPFVYPASPTII